MKQKLLSWPFIICTGGALLLFMVLTDPTKLAITWLLVPFFLLFVFELQLILKFMGRRRRPISKRKLASAATIAGTLTGLLVLSSVHQLTIKDVLILLILGFGLSWYGRRLDLSPK